MNEFVLCVLMLIHSEEFTEEALQVLLAVITGGNNFMPHHMMLVLS